MTHRAKEILVACPLHRLTMVDGSTVHKGDGTVTLTWYSRNTGDGVS